jgi:ATP-binding cassette subfamily F protein 3
VILVSHDMHLLGLVADRLWLVKGGAVTPYTEDLEAYRRQLLAGEDEVKIVAKPVERKRQATREEVLSLKAEVRKCEDRLSKLNDMRDKLAKKLADPSLYEDSRKGELATWNAKYAEVMQALDKAEAMWLTAQEKLESAAA